MRPSLLALTLLAASAGVISASQAAGQTGVPGPNDQLKLFPATYGRFAPRGDCTRLPRVTVSVAAIRIETTAGAASFTHPNAVTNFMGPEDESITYQLQGPGEGLQVSIKGKTLMTAGGEHLGAPERALRCRCGPEPQAAAALPAMSADRQVRALVA